jgi:hypothetical protein
LDREITEYRAARQYILNREITEFLETGQYTVRNKKSTEHRDYRILGSRTRGY